ncbi:MAG: efflux RND transporter periplasmic adaptor subunit [Chloroflexi bacterium]|nr:efflux RND transporter periplasmic adaptor subunit [Chloroflexota bacterium]
MEALWNALKTLSVWQIIVLVAVMFGSAAAVYFLYTNATQPDTTELAENQQLIPVQYGDIVNQVSTNGSVTFPERETLRFGIEGTIGELLVEKGQSVSTGQELARLDAPTIATLEEAVAQAMVDVLDAQEDLDVLREPSSEATRNLELATAEEAVASARFEVQQAREALEELLDPELPGPLEIEAKKEEIAAAEFLIQQRQEEMEDLLNPELPSNQELKAQEELIADARVKLQEARDSRDELVSRNLQPDYAMKLAEALQQRADAEKELAEIQQSLDELEPSERELAQARQDLLKAQIALDEANQSLEDFLDTHGSNLTNRRHEKTDLEADLASARETLGSLQEAYDQGRLGLSSNITRWEIYAVNLEEELEQVRFGIVSEVEELETDVVLAQVALAEAEELLAEVEQGPDALERAALEARVEAVTANQEVVERDLAELEQPEVDPQELALRDARIVLAEANLAQAIEDLEELKEDLGVTPDTLELALNSQQLELAVAALAERREEYAQLLEDMEFKPDPFEVALGQQRIVLAEATLARAEENLSELVLEHAGPPDTLDVALAEKKIVAANVRLATAEEELRAAIVTSPLTGYVAEVSVEQGDNIEARAAIMEVVDPTIVEIDGIVDEIDVLLVQTGTAAEVQLDALPGMVLEGLVTEIAEIANNEQGVVSFPIRIRMEVPEGVRPREGLSAVANIVLQEELNVLLVPQQALYGSFDRPLVRILTDGGVSEQQVDLGNRDDFWVAVKAGLSEGDQIIFESADVGASEFSFRNLRRATGGSLGGGGGGRR